jgi:hypothetical protein
MNDLTQALARQAERFAERGGTDIEMVQVLARAGEIRRGRRMRASMVMAAVAIAVAVPIGITTLVGNAPDKHHTVVPTTDDPSPTTTTTRPDALAVIPLGARPRHSYVLQGAIHDVDGTTRQLPAGSSDRLAAITPYLGGYLVANGDTSTVTLYDGSGKTVKSGPGSSTFVTTSDGVETAYTMNGKLFSNPGSGMANGDGAVGPISVNGAPVGYLQGGLLYETGKTNASGAPELALTGGGSLGHDLDSLRTINATENLSDRVAGVSANGEGTVVSVKTHKVLWTSKDWEPVAFDYNGKYVAAVNLSPNDPREIAILDATTFRVIASSDLASKDVEVNGGPVFDDGGNLLVVGMSIAGDVQTEALLRLSPANRLDRATRVVKLSNFSDNETPLVIPVGPQ